MKRNKKSVVNPWTKKVISMSDEELFDELRGVVNAARNNGVWNRELAKAVGKECRKRKFIREDKMHGL